MVFGMTMNIVNADCMEVELPKCRLLLTDIPYTKVNRSDNGLRKLDKSFADIGTFKINNFLEKIFSVADVFIMFCGNEQYSEIYDWFNEKTKEKKGTVRQIIWAKTNPSPMNGEYVYLSGTENAVWFKKSGTGKLNSKCKKNWFMYPTGSSKFHPTEKNHKLLEDLILDNTSENDLIVDTCMGSGSTGLVAIKNKRKFFGIEINSKYFEIAKERLMVACEKSKSEFKF